MGRYRIYTLPEGEPELPGHGAVEDEVDHAVHKGHHVHQLQEKCFQIIDSIDWTQFTSPTGM